MHYDRALCGERHAAVVGVPHGGVKFLAEKGALRGSALMLKTREKIKEICTLHERYKIPW